MDGDSIESLRLVGGHPALDFANTLGQQPGGAPNEHLVDYAALVAWSARVGLLTPAQAAALRRAARAQPARAARALDAALALRQAIFALCTAAAAGKPPPRAALARLNARLAAAPAQLTPTPDGIAW